MKKLFTVNWCGGGGRTLGAENVAADATETSVCAARTQHSAGILVVHGARNLNPVVGASPVDCRRGWTDDGHRKSGRGRTCWNARTHRVTNSAKSLKPKFMNYFELNILIN